MCPLEKSATIFSAVLVPLMDQFYHQSKWKKPGFTCPLLQKAQKTKKKEKSAEISSLLPAVRAMSDETSPLSTSEHTAERPRKDNELFQQFLPESTHNAIHLPDSSEAETPSSARCSEQRYAPVNSLCIPLHPSTTLHRSSQSVFGH